MFADANYRKGTDLPGAQVQVRFPEGSSQVSKYRAAVRAHTRRGGRRTRPHSESRLPTVGAPLVATVLLSGATVLIAWFVNGMTVGGPMVDGIIVVSVPTTFLLGFWCAIGMRKNLPTDYARIRSINVDADTLESN